MAVKLWKTRDPKSQVRVLYPADSQQGLCTRTRHSLSNVLLLQNVNGKRKVKLTVSRCLDNVGSLTFHSTIGLHGRLRG
jgi:hypothetical protein